MAKCLNCVNEAIWLVETKGAQTQVFCDLDLPWFLRKAAVEGTLPRLDKKADFKREAETKKEADIKNAEALKAEASEN
jgi:hypothetical protein